MKVSPEARDTQVLPGQASGIVVTSSNSSAAEFIARAKELTRRYGLGARLIACQSKIAAPFGMYMRGKGGAVSAFLNFLYRESNDGVALYRSAEDASWELLNLHPRQGQLSQLEIGRFAIEQIGTLVGILVSQQQNVDIDSATEIENPIFIEEPNWMGRWRNSLQPPGGGAGH